MAAELLVSKISVILDEMAPIKTVQVRSNFVPGLEDETKELLAERNRAHELAEESDNPDDWRQYRSLRNVRADKKRWEQQKFNQDEKL